MEKVAIFPGSFDPFTRGHANIVAQALKLFDRVVVAVGCNSEKRGFLSVDTRLDLIADCYKDEPRVSAVSYEGLTVDYALYLGAVAMIRGVRSSIDFEYERTLSAVNNRLSGDVVTVMLVADAACGDISSSVVRELHSYGHSVADFLPEGIELENYIK